MMRSVDRAGHSQQICRQVLLLERLVLVLLCQLLLGVV
jgi:hypothetical protein